MRVSFAKGYHAPLPEDHVFPMGKFVGLYNYVIEKGIVSESQIIAPVMAELSHLMSVHTGRYADAVIEGTLDSKEIRRLGLPWSKPLAVRSRLAVQGTINAALMALQDGVAGNLAGGTHHAMMGHGEGFCVFNDVAVAIKVLKQSMWVRKVLVIDLDVHQGNGTAEIFKEDPDVYTLSIHGEKNYPFHKPPSTLDVGLPDGTGDREYQRILEETLDIAFGRFSPDLIFYLGGIDPLKEDYFGRLSLTRRGLTKRDHTVAEAAETRNIPLVLLLSGGYAPSLRETVEAHALMYRAAQDVYGGRETSRMQAKRQKRII